MLRFVSVMAATLLVPVTWTFTRLLARRQIVPAAGALWAALFAATSPFFLWYGQEARPYALWALLTLLSTYLLLRATEDAADAPAGNSRRGWSVGYVLVLLATLATHYYAVFMLPVHA
ncbi:MAG: glycosyltransferase family 39 protein [Caldilineaceae bacterium]